MDVRIVTKSFPRSHPLIILVCRPCLRLTLSQKCVVDQHVQFANEQQYLHLYASHSRPCVGQSSTLLG
jgi:hypothetical protein